MADNKDLRVELTIEYLNELGFQSFLIKYDPLVNLSPRLFEKLAPKHFHLVFYFLFTRLDMTRTKKTFRSVFPARDITQENDFKKYTIQWLQEISKNNATELGKIVPVIFHRLSGEQFISLIYKFTFYVFKFKFESVLAKADQSLSSEDSERLTQDKAVSNQQFASGISNFQVKFMSQEEEIDGRCKEVEKAKEFFEQAPDHEFFLTENSEMQSQIEKNLIYLTSLVCDSMDQDGSCMMDSSARNIDEDALVNQLRSHLTIIDAVKGHSKEMTKAIKSMTRVSKGLEILEKLGTKVETITQHLDAQESVLRQKILATPRAVVLRAEIEQQLAPLFRFNFDSLKEALDTFEI